jgi:hypothetical protein
MCPVLLDHYTVRLIADIEEPVVPVSNYLLGGDFPHLAEIRSSGEIWLTRQAAPALL